MSKKNKYEITKLCAYCELAECLNDPDIMLCSLNGIVAADHKCRKFLYDPLKRDPAPPIKLPELDKDALIL